GAASDSVDGTAGGGRDLVRAAGVYDDATGAPSATLTFTEPTTAETNAKFTVAFAPSPSCGGLGGAATLIIGMTGVQVAKVVSSALQHPPPGLAPVPQPPDASWTRSGDGREITVSYTDARLAGLDFPGFRV